MENANSNTNMQYAKYKPQFKNLCILKAVSSVVALCAIIFLIFVPNFTVGGIFAFSLFDEIMRSFNSLGAGLRDYTAVLEIYQIIAVIYLAISLVFAVVSLIKSILNITNMETYALEQYDDIKTRANESKKRWGNRFTLTNCIMGAIVLEVLYIVMQTFIPSSGAASSYFAYIDGVSWMIMFFIIFAIAFIVLAILSANILKKVKMSILKEDYGLSTAAPQQAPSENEKQ